MLGQGEINTRRLPSGDQSGWQAPSFRFVTWCRSLPSEFISHNWGFPLRSDTNAICSLLSATRKGVADAAGVSVASAVPTESVGVSIKITCTTVEITAGRGVALLFAGNVVVVGEGVLDGWRNAPVKINPELPILEPYTATIIAKAKTIDPPKTHFHWVNKKALIPNKTPLTLGWELPASFKTSAG